MLGESFEMGIFCIVFDEKLSFNRSKMVGKRRFLIAYCDLLFFVRRGAAEALV